MVRVQGFMVGNAWTDAAIDNRGALDFWHQHALIATAAHDAVTAACKFGRVGPLESAEQSPVVRIRREWPMIHMLMCAAALCGLHRGMHCRRLATWRQNCVNQMACLK